AHAFVPVNCAAIPEALLESELFGHVAGAFTDARSDRKGLFLEAHGSTILLDEIADIPVSVQTKLLRVLQEKEIQPLGQNKTIKVDVRVVASTNQDLEAKIQTGEFREDLFYRLNVVTIVMPNLEEMKDDIPLLIHHFLSQFRHRYDRKDLKVPSEVLQELYRRKWQGNVRELQNSIKRLVLLATEGTVALSDLEELLRPKSAGPVSEPGAGSFQMLFAHPYNEAKAAIIKQFTIEYLSSLLARHNGNVTVAAGECGIERQALPRLMRRYGIVSADFKKNQ
ncbi:MAG: sigma 54-interacting transcriptional regulator, partial [Desulforhopalus sp.]